MKAIKNKVTVLTYEVKDGEDFVVKTKITSEIVGEPKHLADSSVERQRNTFSTWLKRAKAKAQSAKMLGKFFQDEIEYWVEHTSPTVAKNPEPTAIDKGASVKDEVLEIELKEEEVIKKLDEDLTFTELRSKYPDIKAVSKTVFLSKLAANV